MIEWLGNNWIALLLILAAIKLFHSLFKGRDIRKLTDEFADVIVSRWQDADYYYGKKGSEFSYDPNNPNCTWNKIAKRDSWTCHKCKRQVYPSKKSSRLFGRRRVNVDHIVPFVYGGQGTIDNGRTACYRCNIRRKAKIDRDCLLKVREQGKKIYLGKNVPKFIYERKRK